MSLCKIKMPDLGEGMTECEIVEWQVKVGDTVKEDDVIAGVMTDKAVVEIPSPVDGVITELSGEVGELVPVGTVIVVLEVADVARAKATSEAPEKSEAPKMTIAKSEPVKPAKQAQATKPVAAKLVAEANNATISPERTAETITATAEPTQSAQTSTLSRQLSAPAVKQRAKNLGIDINTVLGSGPDGRVLHQDLDQLLLQASHPTAIDIPEPISTPAIGQALTNTAPMQQEAEQLVTPQRVGPMVLADAGETTTTSIIGLRRKIAERMQDAKQRIPHITYVEAIDVTELESLRAHLNQQRRDDQPKLSLLPMLFRAITLATRVYPVMNAHYDDVNGKLHQYQALHLGVATQTDRGLLVPVLRHADQMDIWESAAGIKRLADMARLGTLAKDELSGSTITCSSLGKLGGLVSTPVINSPEICVIGVNKIQTQPVYKDGGFVPRHIMNLSSSFDHRIVDGYEAAQFIQCLREHLEHPATLFIE
ncbi:dihydrolipoamide acetyltransferase family protein [Leucothrix pacifica]|uniref:Dihydrolipoamide acetyltransferase component of pyruvate dehydrogenase complex n=1 Tax=Leucothrix pacifica TaxID=1247513 RepID=A0A317CIY0_9GAMM|nr:dihydrolipoamide acetyltransferase family protein [Leucothrix pacifica]PWQ97383.1 branched-chain alpha-keto acid dehydrogenase subunit E2 [Leucothrix pacifica]